MNTAKEPVVTEEPLPGWLRFETEGEKPWYKTPPPRTVIRANSNLKEFLEKEHKQNRKLDIDGSEFSFKRRLGLKSKINTPPDSAGISTPDVLSEALSVTSLTAMNDKSPSSESRELQETAVDRLVRGKDVINHRKLLSACSKTMDSFRLTDGYHSSDGFENLKSNIASSCDLRGMLIELNSNIDVVDALDLMFSDCCLMEISRIPSNRGPLVDFPVSLNTNVYCEIVEFGMKNCPRLIHFVMDMVVRRGRGRGRGRGRFYECFVLLCWR